MTSFILGILPVVLSLLILAAHFLRSSNIALVVLCVMLMALLFVPRRWTARTIQVSLVLAALEWLRTLMLIAQERTALGAPYTRTAIILGAVALFTLGSTLVFRTRVLRKRYRLD